MADLWAEILPVRGNEELFTERLQAETLHRIQIRYRSDITPRHRFTYEGRIFSIRTIRNLYERDELMEITVQEGSGA